MSTDTDTWAAPGGAPAGIGRYRFCSELGRGGMGVVHLAVDGRGRAVAVKVLRDHLLEEQGARARLAREVEHLSRIRHAGVAGVVDADVEGPRPYIVTRYIPGPSLERYVEEHGPLGAPELLGLARDLCDALAAVHAAGVVHRDLKPANVLLHDGRPVLIDFGIAHGVADSRLTSTGLVMGTPGFLAPEVLDGAQVGAATDWWAWAATLAFAASGRLPFGGGRIDAVLARIRAGEADLRGVSPRLAPLLRAALDPRPERRPRQSQILAELERQVHLGASTAALPALPSTQAMPGVVTQVSPVPAATYPHHVARQGSRLRAEGHRLPTHRPAASSAVPVAATATSRPAPRPAAVKPAAAPSSTVAAPPREPAPPKAGGRPRGPVLALGLLLAAMTLVAPVSALIAGIVWSWLARTVDAARVGLLLRRGERGRQRGDVAGTVVRAPFQAIGALARTLVGAGLPALVGACGLLGGLALQDTQVLGGSASNPAAPGPLLLAAGGALIVGWWGPGTSSVRRGSRVVLSSVARGRDSRAVLVGVLVVIAIGVALVSRSSGFEPTWSPLPGDPFGWARTARS